MFRSILIILAIFMGLTAFAGENYLNSVVISKNDGETSVILRSDEVAKVKKEIVDLDKMILTLKGISQAADMNTLYKNTSDVSGLVIQNDGNNGLKIYVEAPNISKSNVVFETPNSAPIIVNDGVNEEKVIWSIISIVLLLFVMNSAKNIGTEDKPQVDVNEIIKEREKALYRNFQREVATIPSMSYKLKSYRKHVLKGETIRSYESRTSAKV